MSSNPTGRPFVRTMAFTRPADTTQYTAGDAVSDNATTPTVATFALPSMAYSGFGGIIHGVVLHKSDQDQTGADFDIYFFDTQPAAAGWEDNAAIAITDAEWKRCVGFVSFVASTDARSVATGDIYCKTNLDIAYECVGGDSLYVLFVARGTYTPGNAEVFTLNVGAVVR
jgi:hypothetical protein